MKHLFSLIAATLFCVFSVQSNAQQNSGQCKYNHTTYCGIVVEMTVPCDWMNDWELMMYIEEDVDITLCG